MTTPESSNGRRRIVVGVDGSDTSRHALRWAAEEATVHESDLHVVYAWDVPVIDAGAGVSSSPRTGTAPDSMQDAAEQLVSTVVQEELGDNPPANVRQSVGRGSAPRVLLDAAKGADLLVLGSRGLGGFAGLLLGSVSMKMAHHAGCPVVIVRPTAPADES